ncbi:MAG: beta-ketoacyl-ACP synthase II [Holosporaceae bacterium]
MRRVVVTGMGLVSPLASGVQASWDRLLKGHSGIRSIDLFDTEGFAAKVAGLVPHGTDAGTLDMDGLFSKADQKKNDRFILYALAASDEALKDAGIQLETEEEKERFGVLISSGIGGLPKIYETSVALCQKGPRGVSPFFIPSCLVNLASGQVSIRHQLKGPNLAGVTACAAGTHAIGEAMRLIQTGDADVMLAGGAEAAVCPLGVAGFASMRALSTSFNDTPQEASRPFDKKRDGFVMGEGAGLLVIEELEHARKRGATIYAEIKGYGLSGDAFHMAAPDGKGAERAMKMALQKAQLSVEDIAYINAHGTSTPQGDAAELKAVHAVFGAATRNLSVSSTKSATGHLLGAAGGLEAVFAIQALRHNCVPPTLNLHETDIETDLDLVPLKAKEKPLQSVLSNSFGFGGTNASVVFSKEI